MNLPHITDFNPTYTVARSEYVDLSRCYLPKAKNIRLGGTTVTYYSSYQNRTLKLNNITAPNITSLSTLCSYFVNLRNFEAINFDTSKVTTLYYSFYYCYNLPRLDISS